VRDLDGGPTAGTDLHLESVVLVVDDDVVQAADRIKDVFPELVPLVDPARTGNRRLDETRARVG
jgi:hypothetical protein